MGQRRRQLNMELPALICGEPDLPCGKRRKNKACHNPECWRSIPTTGKQVQEKAILLAYAKGE